MRTREHPIHPGIILADELEELQVTAAELARELHVPANRIYQLVGGKRAMTADTDALNERNACLTILCAVETRLRAASDQDTTGTIALEARRVGEAIESVRQGLHRTETDHASQK